MTDKKIDFVLVDGDEQAWPEEGPSRADVQLATEIGKHAAVEALDALFRVLETVPLNVHKAAVAVAHAELGWSLERLDGALDMASPGFKLAVEKLRASRAEASDAGFEEEAKRAYRGVFGRDPG